MTPAEKLRLVESLQAEREVVAVTGDGVNDAPALRLADVGVAMGRGGTEAARESADLVLTDDDFATIVAAIREGRAIADNIRKFVAFLLSANLGEVALFAVAIFAGLGVPMTVVQVLLVNVLTDGLPAVALTRDPAARGHDAPAARARGPPVPAARVGGAGRHRRPRRARRARRLPRRPLRRRTTRHERWPSRRSRSPSWRSSSRCARPSGPPGRRLGTSISSEASSSRRRSCSAALYLPTLNEPLGTVPLGASELGVVAALALVPFLCVEIGKALLRRSGWTLEAAQT